MKPKKALPIIKKEDYLLDSTSAFIRRMNNQNEIDSSKFGLEYYLSIDSKKYYDSLDNNSRFDFPYNYIKVCSKNINLKELLEYFNITEKNYNKYLEIKNEE